MPVDAAPAQIPGTGLSIDESFRRLDDSDTRVMLKHIELDPAYAALLHACLQDVHATPALAALLELSRIIEHFETRSFVRTAHVRVGQQRGGRHFEIKMGKRINARLNFLLDDPIRDAFLDY